MLFTVTILVCLSSMPKAECNSATAVDTTVLSEPRGAAACGLSGQETLAQTVLLRPGTYAKIRCRPVEQPAGDVG